MTSETLWGLLADQGIPKLRRYTSGAQQNSLICPKCAGGNHREGSLNVRIDDDGQGATWVCHRGSCGWKAGARLKHDPPPQRPRKAPLKPLEVHLPWEEDDRPDWLYGFFGDRHIGAPTVDHFGVYARDRWFAKVKEERPAIVFPFRWNRKIYSRKYRCHGEKDFSCEAGEPTLFNADSLAGAETVIWAEGEPDVMALHECGYIHAVSLRDGAGKEARFNPDDVRFDALQTHADELAQVKTFILAGDMDGPGLALREELARRLGRHKVRLVTWPEGCKDACDTLRGENGFHALRQAVEAAVPYPIDGLYRLQPGMLTNLRMRGKPAVMTSGTSATDRAFKLPADGRLITITGIPNHGKSTWLRFVMIHTARQHGRKWLVFTPEHEVEHYFSECAETYVGKRFWPAPGLDSMTPDEEAGAEEFLTDRVQVMQCDNETQEPTLDWLLERAAYCVLRDGVSDVVLDPWNEIAHKRGDLTETEYTSRVLGRFRSFINRHGCNLWIVAHPAKPPVLKAGEKRKPPTAYDISGSAAYANKTDMGFTVHSEAPGEVDVILWKSRHARLWGQRGAVARLDFDGACGRYRDPVNVPDDDDMPATAPRWQDNG